MAPSKPFFSFLLPFLLVVILVKNAESQNTNFDIFIFNPGNYGGDAFVAPGTSFLRMTAVNGCLPLQNSFGRLVHNTPFNLWADGRQSSFETTITFQMTPAGNFSTETLGHGLTFFMVPFNSLRPTGGSGNNLGIYDNGTPIFAAEFDLNDDGITNPRFPHIGININTMISQVVSRYFLYGRHVVAEVTYDAPTKIITVNVRSGNTIGRVSFNFDLRSILPQQVQIGLSASTGTQRLAFLDIHSWSVRSRMVADPIGAHHNTTDIKSHDM